MVRYQRPFEGHTLLMTRRRYGDTTFTWVHVQMAGEWVSLGAPWPCMTPPKEQLRRQIARTLAERGASHG